LNTRLERLVNNIYRYAIKIFQNRLANLSLGILSLLLGFFMSTTLSTIPGQTGDWGLIGAAIIVTFYEIASRKIYKNRQKTQNYDIRIQINSIKIGVIYGLFVDAFKLGS
jgi:Protein of unknown function (DUF565)